VPAPLRLPLAAILFAALGWLAIDRAAHLDGSPAWSGAEANAAALALAALAFGFGALLKTWWWALGPAVGLALPFLLFVAIQAPRSGARFPQDYAWAWMILSVLLAAGLFAGLWGAAGVWLGKWLQGRRP